MKMTFEERTALIEAAEPVGPRRLDAEFWDKRPYLAHIRQAAHARQRSAPAVLGVVLARAAAVINHRIRLPAIVGADSSVSIIDAIVAASGVGKTSANSIAAELLPVPPGLDMLDQLPIGTGEGIAEAFFDIAEETNDKGKVVKVKRQARHNAFFYVDEGQVLGELGNRKGAVLLQTMRSAFSGSVLGQTNASEERRRVLPARSYTISFVIGIQTELAGAILDDAAGGTPQRVLWWSGVDPTVPDERPEWPGRLPWSPPDTTRIVGLGDDGKVLTDKDPVYLEVAESIQVEIRAGDLARVRGESILDALDAHAQLVQLKVAALLALLDDRLAVGEEDWQLAARIKTESDATRAMVEASVAAAKAEKSRERSRALADQAAHQDVAVRHRRTVDCARRIAAKVWADPKRWQVSTLRRELRRWREEFNDGLDHAFAEAWVVEVTEPGQGEARRLLWPGDRRPS